MSRPKRDWTVWRWRVFSAKGSWQKSATFHETPGHILSAKKRAEIFVGRLGRRGENTRILPAGQVPASKKGRAK